MRRLALSLFTLTALVAGAGPLAGCASGGGPDASAAGQPGTAREQSPPSRIGGFLREAAGYLTRRDLVDVGDPAPDFALTPLRFYDFGLDERKVTAEEASDPYRAVRLSAFAGKRPVALVFGSYT